MSFLFTEPPLYKWFDPWDVDHLSLLESLTTASSLSTFKHTWKRATLLVLVMVKFCSDLTYLHLDNQHLFLQHHAFIFITASGCKMDQVVNLLLQNCIESHSNVNLCPVFYLKAYLHHTKPFRKK